MILDYVEAFNVKHIAIIPRDKDKFPYTNRKMPLIRTVFNENETLFANLPDYAKLVEKNPNYLIKHLQFLDIDYNPQIVENKTLGELIEPEKVLGLYGCYKKKKKLYTDYQEAEIAFQEGKRKTDPLDEMPLTEESERIFKGYNLFDRLFGAVEDEIVRQHLNHHIAYNKKFSPERISYENEIFKLAHRDGTDNHGHSSFNFDIYKTKKSTTTQPDGISTLFPVTVLKLKKVDSKSGYGDREFDDKFYEK